jgi:hypothetical protein
LWHAARRGRGDAAGTRALIGVLLLHRTTPAAALEAGMTAALRLDRFEADLVAVEARRTADERRPAAAVVPLPSTAPPAASIERGAPSLAGYDELLTEETA